MATSTTSANHGAAREKRLAALSSVLAAVALTTLKLVVGLMTGSLGILSEAAHSGLDLVAALVTLFAVRISDTPPDQRHRYGHGKVENLSALIETLLLLLTCAWIIYEAIRRLFFEEVAVEASIWAFVVMGVSVLVDFSRSRVLARTARKYNSQALEADALHFSTDIWSALVVILGLIGVRLSEASSRLAFLAKADAVAALVVAMIVVYVSVQLGRRSVAALLDSAPPGLAAKIERAVRAVPGVLDCHRVRVRTAGPQLFVDIHVVMDGALSLEETHALSSQIEEII
ncbi:MAG TPA: cation diffusion facilitator family transporter, partial [Aggregatilineaceae bacterium]|nr:cation diffusion facilitator family transporter [Aggregatilineaceae bacterium]